MRIFYRLDGGEEEDRGGWEWFECREKGDQGLAWSGDHEVTFQNLNIILIGN